MLRPSRLLLLVCGIVVGFAACRYDPTKEPENLPPIPTLQLTRISDQARSAIEGAQARVRQYPGDPLLNGELGMQLQANRRYQEAAVMYDRARKIHTNVFRWEYYRGVVLSEINDVTEAVASFRRALELKENEPNALLGLAQIYFKSAKLANSEALVAEGEKTLDLLIETNPDYVHGPMLRAARLEEAGKPKEAIKIYEALTGKEETRGFAHQSLARLYDQIGDPDRAERERALAQQSRRITAPNQNEWMAAVNRLGVTSLGHEARGQMLLQNRMFEPAAQEFELAVQEDPRNVGLRVNLVALYGIAKQPQKAQNHYQAALRIGGADAKLHVNMGNIELNAGRLKEAEQAYTRALEADGSVVKAHLGLGRIALLRRNPKRAENFVRQALALEPLNPAVYWELARALRAEGKPAQAAQALEKGVSYSEGRTAVRLLRTLAQLYEIAGDQAAAKDALDRARLQAERSQSNVDLALIDAQMDAYDGLDDLSETP